MHVSFPTLSTTRLNLRRITADDAPRLLEILGDEQAMRWFGSDPLPDLNAARQLIERLDQGWKPPTSGIRWGICTATDNQLIGSCGFMGWNRQNASCRIGYELHPSAQGHGFMAEALREILEYGFEVMELHRVVAEIHPDNLASRRVAEGLGFAVEGRQRDAGWWGGRHQDLLLYSLLRPDWVHQPAGSPRPAS